MNTTTVTDQKCMETLRLLDMWMDKQLPEAEASAVDAHLRECPHCFAESELRTKVRLRMRAAVQANAPSPYLNTRVMANLRQHAHEPAWFGWKQKLSAVAAMLVVCVGTAMVARELGYLRFTAESRERYIGSISTRVSTLMRVALGDHVHCSVYGIIPKQMPKPEEVVNQLPAEYRDLMPLVQENIPSEYRLYSAHYCSYKKRRFLHFAMKNGNDLVSLIITRRQPGEKFEASEAVSSLAQSGVTVYGSGVQRFQIAGFETDQHLAYIVSDMSKDRNRQLMLALAPVVHGYLAAHKS